LFLHRFFRKNTKKIKKNIFSKKSKKKTKKELVMRNNKIYKRVNRFDMHESIVAYSVETKSEIRFFQSDYELESYAKKLKSKRIKFFVDYLYAESERINLSSIVVKGKKFSKRKLIPWVCGNSYYVWEFNSMVGKSIVVTLWNVNNKNYLSKPRVFSLELKKDNGILGFRYGGDFFEVREFSNLFCHVIGEK